MLNFTVMDKDLIRAAAAKVGGVVKLSINLGLSRAAASQWDRIPVEHVLAVERMTGVSRYALRPDIYGPRPVPTPDHPAPEREKVG